jgi:hypothetical protein
MDPGRTITVVGRVTLHVVHPFNRKFHFFELIDLAAN